LTACAPLAKHSLWFSQRLLVLLLVKAANMPKSGASLAKDSGDSEELIESLKLPSKYKLANSTHDLSMIYGFSMVFSPLKRKGFVLNKVDTDCIMPIGAGY